MKPRLVLTSVLTAALGLGLSAAQAAPTPVLDGKKIKQLVLKADGGLQDNDSDNVTEALSSPDRADCTAPRCARLPFVYKPAKGVKGNIMFTITWSNPASDFDLYVAEIAKDGSASTLDDEHCGGSGGTSEKLYVTSNHFKVGHKYALVADFYRSVNDSVTGTVQINVPSTVKSTVPDQYDGQFPGTVVPINCTQ